MKSAPFLSLLCVLTTPFVSLAQCPTSPTTKGEATVIEFGAEKISLSQLDKEISDDLCAAKMAYDLKVSQLRQEAAEELVLRRLVEAEVKRGGFASEEALFAAKVSSQLKPPTEADIKNLYDQAQDELAGKTLEEVRPALVQYLAREQSREAFNAFLMELKKKAKAKISIPVYRLPVSTTGPSLGPKDAKVVIVEYADYECPYCAKAGETMKAVLAQYPKSVRVVFKDFPLDFHENAISAAVAARCAGQQGKFWEMHDALFANMRVLGDEKYAELATRLQLNQSKFSACLDDPKHVKAVLAEREEAGKFGVEGTPAFFVNGIPLSGAQPLEAFTNLIERELGR